MEPEITLCLVTFSPWILTTLKTLLLSMDTLFSPYLEGSLLSMDTLLSFYLEDSLLSTCHSPLSG